MYVFFSLLKLLYSEHLPRQPVKRSERLQHLRIRR